MGMTWKEIQAVVDEYRLEQQADKMIKEILSVEEV